MKQPSSEKRNVYVDPVRPTKIFRTLYPTVGLRTSDILFATNVEWILRQQGTPRVSVNEILP